MNDAFTEISQFLGSDRKCVNVVHLFNITILNELFALMLQYNYDIMNDNNIVASIWLYHLEKSL